MLTSTPLHAAAAPCSPCRSLAGQFAGVPGIVSLSGGFPPATLFPFAGITLHLAGSGAAVPITDPAAVSCAI